MAKWFSVCLQTKWLWVRVSLQSLFICETVLFFHILYFFLYSSILSFSSSGKFLNRSWPYPCFLFFSSSERSWYLWQAFFVKLFFVFFDDIWMTNLYTFLYMRNMFYIKKQIKLSYHNSTKFTSFQPLYLSVTTFSILSIFFHVSGCFLPCLCVMDCYFGVFFALSVSYGLLQNIISGSQLPWTEHLVAPINIVACFIS